METASSASRLVQVNSNKHVGGRLMRENHTLTAAQVQLLKEQEGKAELEWLAGKWSCAIFLEDDFH
jgi:hypothetical protein